MAFLDFCRKVAGNEPLDIQTPINSNYPVPKLLPDLIKKIESKMDWLDQISIPFVEDALKDMDQVVDILERECGGDIPDNVVNELCKGLYNFDWEKNNNGKMLTEDEQAIIKTLAIYIIIQNTGRNGFMSNNYVKLEPVPTTVYKITSAMVKKHLAYIINSDGIGCDFTRWTGVSGEDSYVRMRVAIKANDILCDNKSTEYVDMVLAQNAAGLKFDADIIERIAPFMYPETTANIRNFPEDVQRLFQSGLYGERLDEVIQNRKFTYCKEADCFRIYLRPERIIADMFEKNNIKGQMSIIGVLGTTSETIRWVVAVSKSNSFSDDDISIDRIFNSAG